MTAEVLRGRRWFLGMSGAVAGAAALGGSFQAMSQPGDGGQQKLTLGMASYTFRSFSRDEAVRMTLRLGLGKIAFKDMHLPYETPLSEIANIAAGVRQSGLDLYGCGVVYMTTDAEVRRAFDYAKAAGMRIIIGVPEHPLLDLAEEMVKKTGISLAIHNHGPGDARFPSPESVWERVKGRDPRMGLCLDIGHTARLGLDPAKEVERFGERILDVHIKDVSAPTEAGTTVEIGRGVIDIPAFVRALVKLNYRGVCSLEHEKDPKDPLAGAAESVGYLRGVMKII